MVPLHRNPCLYVVFFLYVYAGVMKVSLLRFLKYFLIIAQRDATQIGLFIILQVHSTCFGCQPHPSSGVHKTVAKASGICAATSLQRSQLDRVGRR